MTDWPKLLHLYSRLRPGKTVMEWMEEYNVNELGVDVRRFTSFGVIKVAASSAITLANINNNDFRGSFAESTDGRCYCLKTPMHHQEHQMI